MITIEPPTREGTITRGARRVGWRAWGPRGGTVVVFCTGAGMTSSLGFGFAELAARGLELVCVDRAGLGRSDPDPAKSLASYAADVEAVLAALGATDAVGVGFSQGAPFAVALAATGRISRLALVAPTDELAHPALRPLLAPDIARLVDGVGEPGFEFAFANQVTADGLWALILAMSAPEDVAVYHEPAFAAAYRATLAEGFAQGGAGYARDFVLASTRWAFPPEVVGVPVALWIGAADTSPVHTPDGGATLAARFPTATRHAIDAGAALLWTHSAAILEALTPSR